MANFYNPYMKTPDWGAGISNIFNQIMQLRMFNQMFPKSEVDIKDLEQAMPQGMPSGQPWGGLQGMPQNQFGQQPMPNMNFGQGFGLGQGQQGQFNLGQDPFSQLMQMFQSQMSGQGMPGMGGF